MIFPELKANLRKIQITEQFDAPYPILIHFGTSRAFRLQRLQLEIFHQLLYLANIESTGNDLKPIWHLSLRSSAKHHCKSRHSDMFVVGFNRHGRTDDKSKKLHFFLFQETAHVQHSCIYEASWQTIVAIVLVCTFKFIQYNQHPYHNLQARTSASTTFDTTDPCLNLEILS